MKKALLVVLMLFGFLGVHAQQRAVSGKVMYSNGDAISGVTVELEGTSNYDVVGSDGVYSINGVNEKSNLIFTFLGMKTQKIVVGTRTTIDVKMEVDALNLDDVVVVGYGTMRKSDLTGSVASVKVEEMLEATSAANFESMLQGRVAGLQVINSGNDNPSGGATLRIRGRSSINASNSPLVVVNGIPMGDGGGLNSINPSTIASVEVLKDASATAIYGSRGANGVIMVTTKKGEKGRISVYFDHKTTIGSFSEELDYWRDPVEMMMLSNEGNINAGITPIYNGTVDPSTGFYNPSVEDVQSGAWPFFTKWEDYVFRDVSVTNETSFGIQGGTDKSSYNVNATYYAGEGMKIDDDFQKITMDFDYTNKVSKFLGLTSRAGFFLNERNNVHPGGHTRNPLYPVYNGDGTPYKAHITDYGNPVGTRANRTNTSEFLSAYATVQLDIDIIEPLKVVLRGDVRATVNQNRKFSPILWSEEGDKWGNRAEHSVGINRKAKFDGYVTYDETFADDHAFSAMVGGASEIDNGYSLSGSGHNFESIILGDENLGAAEDMSVSNGESKTVLLSGFGRLNYNYKGLYYATFTARADGCSKFGPGNKWAFFPSAALSWRASEEEFIKNLDLFDNLKLRASYGVSGNQGINPYQTSTVFNWNWTGYEGADRKVYGPGLAVGREGLGNRYIIWGGIGNENLRWEQTAQTDIGLDVSMFGSRLNVTVDIYDKLTTDLLREQFMAPNTGYDRIWTNSGEIQNRGFELSVDGYIVSNDTWQFNAGVIYSMNRNKVLDLGGELESGLITDANGVQYEPFEGMRGGLFKESYFSILAIGQPVGVFYGHRVNGIIQDAPAGVHDNNMAGEFNYVGLREDGTVDSDGRCIIGDPNPDFTASLNLSLRHKIGLDLSVQFYGVYGNDVISTTKYQATDLKSQRWTYDNPSTDRPSLRSNRDLLFSDWFVEDGSFLRLQNITLGYTIPKLPFLKSGRVYISGNNLFTLSKSTLYDPETAEHGFGESGYPRVATCVVGLQL